MAENIIIKQEYFDNIQTAINSLNEYFTSGFKTKNFPNIDEDYQIESTIERVILRLNSVDPTWLEDPNKMHDIIETIHENIKDINPVDGVYETIVNSNNTTLIDSIDAYIGFKMLQFIADHFDEFTKLMNGIYTFEIFTKPSQYVETLDIFNKPLQFDELPEIDVEERTFDDGAFIENIMKLPQISMPDSMTVEAELDRFSNREDLNNVEVFVDDSVQEAAEVNYFENTKPAHMKYSKKTGKIMISKQLEAAVNNLISGLRGCDTTEDLKSYFSDPAKNKNVDMFVKSIVPFIYLRSATNEKKAHKTYDPKAAEPYLSSYESIISGNKGAQRFKNYDLFSTFKADKDGTIQFVEDFLKLKLVNDPSASIANNTLLTIFNIFDSRIYLDIAYNMLPDDKKKGQTEDQYVKEIRGRINKNSRNSSNPYANNLSPSLKEEEVNKDKKETVSEYVSNIIDEMGEMTTTDITYCEHFHDAVMREIDNIDNSIYNEGLSQFLVEQYIGESFNDINDQLDDVFMEANIHKRRERLQSAISSLIADMEEIVSLNKKHQWNNNTFVDKYKTAAGSFLYSNDTGSTKNHNNIKEVFFLTKKAMKGKCGDFTNGEKRTLERLHNLVGDIWLDVKIFYVNPLNILKGNNILNNSKMTKRVKNIAATAEKIVAMKQGLEFIQKDDFVSEAFYDDCQCYVYQEASTEKNHEMLKKSIDIMMEDMVDIQKTFNDKKWTNNTCIHKFKSESYHNVKQALKYVNRATAGVTGIKRDDVDTLKTLSVKLSDIIKNVKIVRMSPWIGRSIKESNVTRKIAMTADEIVKMKSDLEFLNNPPDKNNNKEFGKEATDPTESTETTQESNTIDFEQFRIIMEQEDGSIPEYMRTRLKISDTLRPTVTSVDLPEGVPRNDINELTDSVNAKLDSGGELGDMLGSGFENNPNKGDHEGKIVVNITNNYTNSFNKDSNNTTTNNTNTTIDDHSTEKSTTTNNDITDSNNNTNSHNNSSHHNNIDKSSRKSTSRKTSSNKTSTSSTDKSDHSKKTTTSSSNNNNNSNGSVDSKDSHIDNDNEQKFSSGRTVQEVFMFLESNEPQSLGSGAGKPPKEDSMTKAMDRDRESLSKQQKAKKAVQKVGNTGKAMLKPVTRTKQWLTKMVDSLIKRDEDKVKAELTDNASYRSAVCKAMRLALSIGAVGLCFTIQPYLGLIAVGVGGLRLVDRERVRKEMQSEFEAELEIINDKIAKLDTNNPDDLKEKYKYMRLKKKTEEYIVRSTKSTFKRPNSVR